MVLSVWDRMIAACMLTGGDCAQCAIARPPQVTGYYVPPDTLSIAVRRYISSLICSLKRGKVLYTHKGRDLWQCMDGVGGSRRRRATIDNALRPNFAAPVIENQCCKNTKTLSKNLNFNRHLSLGLEDVSTSLNYLIIDPFVLKASHNIRYRA